MYLQDPTCNYGKIEGNKEIFVARGFSRNEGIEYKETFVARLICKLNKALYELRRNPWDNTYMRILNIT